MGFKARLTNGLRQMGIIETPYDYNPKPGTTHLDVHGLKTEFSELVPGFSQPVWGPEISTVGAYSREGYTTKTFDIPVIPHSSQVEAVRKDEDVQLALNHLASIITGGEHYWKGASDMFTEYIEKFSQDIDFDWFDTILVKELLAYGNSVWKPRLGIQFIRDKDDLMHIPIASFVRIWWDRQRVPYKYEFRGSEYQGYHNDGDIIHFKWNPVNASAFGLGFMTSLLAPRNFEEITPAGPVSKQLPSTLSRKYSTAMSMHIAERRYISRIIYQALEADDNERSQLQTNLANLEVGEDFVVGSEVKPVELGTQQRDFDPAKFTDLTQGAIFKALGDFRGKQGSESSHQYANAEISAVLDEVGLASFPYAVTRQLINKLFKPWYIGNPIYDMSYGGGMVGIPWDDHEPELNFGHVQKQDIELEDAIKLLEIGISSGSITDPIEIRDILEQNGLQLRKEYTDQMTQQQNAMAMNPTGGMGYDYNWDNQTMGTPPMSNSIYDDMSRNPRPTNPALNFTENKKRK